MFLIAFLFITILCSNKLKYRLHVMQGVVLYSAHWMQSFYYKKAKLYTNIWFKSLYAVLNAIKIAIIKFAFLKLIDL